jgi:hypothetical protein
MKRFALGLLVVLAPAAMLRPAAADVFVLSSGGHVDGELANPDENPRQTYVVKLSSGGQISLQAEQVVEVRAVRPDVAQYEKIRSDYPDTVEGQWNLAQWCKEHGLPAQRKVHLRRIIELDPDHARARSLLDYKKIDGQWTTEEEWRTKEGYVKYNGEWKLPQEVKILEEQHAQKLAEAEWFQKIRRWRSWLGTDRNKQARESIVGIDDPRAIKGLMDKLGLIKKDQRQSLDPSEDARLLYVEALGHIHTPEAALALAICSVEDADREVRLSCLDQLESMKSRKIVDYYVGRLNDKDNVIVNRAAVGLSRMKAPSSIVPLIDHLVTEHKQQVGNGGGGGGMPMNMAFPTGGTKGGIGMGMGGGGGGGPKLIRLIVQNQAVLDALVAITGQNFSYDQRAWRTWYASQNKEQPLDARRN